MSDAAPLVSICIANYNGMDIIDGCLRSVLEQQGSISIEILVHDDASTDESADHVRTHYPSVKLICSDSNVGFCIANNRMAAAATGQYLLLLNNDASLFPDAVLTLLTEARRLDAPAILTLPQFDATSGVLVDRGCLLDPFFNPVPNLDPKRQDVAMVIGACLWIPKGLWNELGGFPEWFGSIAEDMYLCCRARLAGYSVCAIGSSGYRHQIGMSFGGGKPINRELATTFKRRALSEKNKTFVMILSYPTLVLLIVLPVHLSSLLVEAIFLTISKGSLRPWREIYAPLLPTLWNRREKLMTLRGRIHSLQKKHGTSFFGTFFWFPWKLAMLFAHGVPKIK